AGDLAGRQEALLAAGDRLDPEAGKMLQAIWFPTEHHLLLVIHHLAVDGVSWRILTSELAMAWNAVIKGEKAKLDPVPFPFRIWAQYLAGQAAAPKVEAQLAVWEALLISGSPFLPAAVLDPERDTVSTVQHLQF